MELRKRICPRCGKEYRGYPALSREDNRTLICPECGMREALKSMNLEENEIEEIVGIVKRSRDGKCLKETEKPLKG